MYAAHYFFGYFPRIGHATPENVEKTRENGVFSCFLKLSKMDENGRFSRDMNIQNL
jgi:hypothetical protein